MNVPKLVAYVGQRDVHEPFLTVGETVTFAAEVKCKLCHSHIACATAFILLLSRSATLAILWS